MRQRDERYAEQAKHKAKGEVLHDKRKPAASPNPKVKGYFSVADFVFEGGNTCTCPAGCTLRSSGALYSAGRYQRQEFKARASDCQACALRSQCIRTPQTAQRKIAVHLRMPDDPNEPIHRMRAAIDSAHGRRLYSQRIATVEPVFGNLRHNKRLSRFTVRGKDKVGTQWRLFCLVHNIEKIAKRGDGT
ncbi:transposase [Roseateles sp. BYS180W]|uniref:Transposase n=1 Tax=Roseateles rivi TaxID=3299028 RepID=A0ABW7FWT1_9BURK